MSSEDTITMNCECGKRLKAPATAAGKRGRCPACRREFVFSPEAIGGAAIATATVTQQAGPAVSRPVVEPNDDAGYDVAEPPSVAARAPAPARAQADAFCTQCASPMEAQALVCMNCGCDQRTGKSLNMASTPARAAAAPPMARAFPGTVKPAKPIDYMAPTGKLYVGVILSAVFALTASILWIAVAWLTGYAIGWIAIIIGIAAGMGMQIGQKGTSKPGGLIAAGMTICAIIFAKIVVVVAILARLGHSILDADAAKLGYYFFNPIGLFIILIGVSAAYRTGSGSSKN